MVPKRPDFPMKMVINPGQKISVRNAQGEELGEGTFLQQTYHEDLDMTAYECEEHTILARGEHYVRVDGRPAVLIRT